MLSEKAIEIAADLAANDGERTYSATERLEDLDDVRLELEPLLVLYALGFNSRERLDRSEIAQFLELFMDPDEYAMRLEQASFFETVILCFDSHGVLIEDERENLLDAIEMFCIDAWEYFLPVLGHHAGVKKYCQWMYDALSAEAEFCPGILDIGQVGYPPDECSTGQLIQYVNCASQVAYNQLYRSAHTICMAYARALIPELEDANLVGLLSHLGALTGRVTGNAQAEADLYRQALAHDPHHGNSLNNLAYNYLRAGGDLQAALDLAQRAIAADGSMPSYRHTLGAIQLALGDLVAAKATWEQAQAELGEYAATTESLAALRAQHPELW